MELSSSNELHQYQYKICGSGIVSFVLVVLMVAFLGYLKRQRCKLLSEIKKLPSNKWRFYHILGDAYHAFRIRKMKTHLPPHIYDFMIFNSYSILFRRESFFTTWASFWPMIFAHKADAMEAVMNNSTNLKKSWIYRFLQPWLSDGLLLSHDTKWKHRRKFLTPAFHFNILKDFLPAINKQSRVLVDILNVHTSDQFIDIRPFIGRCTLDIMCESILGTEIYAQTDPNNPYAKSVSIVTANLSERTFNPVLWPDFIFKMSPAGRKFFKHLKLVHDFTNNIVLERKEQLLTAKSSTAGEEDEKEVIRKRKPFLDLLLNEHINNSSISEEDIRKEVDTFAFAGHDTSSTAISWSMYLIGLHPGVQEKLHQELDSIFGDDDRDATMDDLREMKYLECVLKECLRLYPPAPLIGREIEQDIAFQDYIIPAGCQVFLFIYSLHRDPDVFPNPEKFDPDRFSPENNMNRNAFAYIPFSAGPRNCIGQRFALMELKTVISLILRKFKVRSLDPRDQIHAVFEIVLRPVESLRLEIRPRNH